jgi:excisionase family DNA binding protein
MADTNTASKIPPIIVTSSEQLAELIEAAVSHALLNQRSEAPAPLARARLTVDETAEILRCSPRLVRRLIALGRLHASKLEKGGSSRVLIARSEVDRLIAEAALLPSCRSRTGSLR